MHLSLIIKAARALIAHHSTAALTVMVLMVGVCAARACWAPLRSSSTQQAASRMRRAGILRSQEATNESQGVLV